jgi:ATP phosphoribosyltransferase
MFGFFGTDVQLELPVQVSGQLSIEALVPISGLRFAIAARQGSWRDSVCKIERGEPLRVGTSNPGAVAEIAKIYNIALEPTVVIDGQAEKLALLFGDELDAIVDMKRTGKSLAELDLVTIADDLLPVSLCGAWRRTN